MIRSSKGLYPYYEGNHLIVAVEFFTYADESGMHGTPKYCLVVGFIASPRQWQLFEREWRKVLELHEAAEFHAKDFFGRNPKGTQGLYDKWTSVKADRFLEDLLSVASARRLYPVGGAIDVPAFNSFTYGERKFLTGGLINRSGDKWTTSGAPSKPYYFAMNFLIVDALNQADHNAGVHFVFDEQNNLQARAIQTFRETTKLGQLGNGLQSSQMKSIYFVRSVDSPGIQLADMYCYAWNRHLAKGQSIQEGIHRILETLAKKSSRGPSLPIYEKAVFQKMLGRLPKYVQDRLKANMP